MKLLWFPYTWGNDQERAKKKKMRGHQLMIPPLEYLAIRPQINCNLMSTRSVGHRSQVDARRCLMQCSSIDCKVAQL